LLFLENFKNQQTPFLEKPKKISDFLGPENEDIFVGKGVRAGKSYFTSVIMVKRVTRRILTAKLRIY
jgi:hypothetical protein